MSRRSSTLVPAIIVGVVANKWHNLRKRTSSSAQDEQRTQISLERYRLLSAKVERCVQELIERVYKRNSSLHFDLLAPPSSNSSSYQSNENKELYFDFYLVWKNPGKIQIQRDSSSICCKIKYLDRLSRWSRAEQDRLLLSTVDKKKSSYLNGRGIRDLYIETLHSVAPDLIRLDFIEHLIYFDLIIPSLAEKLTCHITLLPCLHLPTENEVLLPFGTLRWYPRSLLSSSDNSSLISFQQPLQNMSIRHFISTNDIIDETLKITRKDQQAFARVRTIIHELFLPCTLEHIDSIEQLRAPFADDNDSIKRVLFLPHKLDRNCNVFPAGQHLVDDLKAKQFFKEFLRVNIKTPVDGQTDNNEVKL